MPPIDPPRDLTPYSDPDKVNLEVEGNKLVDHGEGLYSLDGTLRFNLIPPARARFPVRMVVIKLKDGGLLVWSPFSPLREVMDAVCSLREHVRFIVAPNSMHWLGVVDFAAACKFFFPDQADPILCAAPGLPDKGEVVKKMQEAGLKWDFVLPDQLPPDWPSDEVAVQLLPGIPLIEEVVMYHKRSKTLIAAELAFNFEKGHPSMDVTWPMTWYLRLVDGYRPCCLTRTFQFLLDDVEATVEAVEAILSGQWRIERFIPAHGLIVERDENPEITFHENSEFKLAL